MKVAVAGLIHGHVGGLISAWKETEGAELVAVADSTPLMDHYGADFQRRYSDWREMLEKESIDALVVTSDNLESAEIAVVALSKGIPCMVEKAMAANAADADRMLSAMRTSGTTLMINWPFAWERWMHEIKRQLDANTIGHAFHLRYRNGHFGPKEIGCDEWFVGWLYDEAKNGGGAIADFGSYGAVLARWLFGMPETVYCLRGNYTKSYDVSDDHALIVLKYPKRSVVLEGTWATFGFEEGANPVVYGAAGTLAAKGSVVTRYAARQDPVVTEAAALPVANPAQYFWNCVLSGTQPEGVLNPEISADGCRILDAAIVSAKSGCAETP
jgi:predicted dehydrogenase